MSEENCPRCHAEQSPHFAQDFESKVWKCGTYREPSGNIYESELCETRQELRSEKAAKEKAEAEVVRLTQELAKAQGMIWPSVRTTLLDANACIDQNEELKNELAKVQKQLELADLCKLTGSQTWEDLNGALAAGELKQQLARAIHYPEHWDTMCYPTLADAVKEWGGQTAFVCQCIYAPESYCEAEGLKAMELREMHREEMRLDAFGE